MTAAVETLELIGDGGGSVSESYPNKATQPKPTKDHLLVYYGVSEMESSTRHPDCGTVAVGTLCRRLAWHSERGMGSYLDITIAILIEIQYY